MRILSQFKTTYFYVVELNRAINNLSKQFKIMNSLLEIEKLSEIVLISFSFYFIIKRSVFEFLIFSALNQVEIELILNIN